MSKVYTIFAGSYVDRIGNPDYLDDVMVSELRITIVDPCWHRTKDIRLVSERETREAVWFAVANSFRLTSFSCVRLLLVEDHEDTRNILGKILRKRGYEVHSAGSGEAALTLAKVHPFDLVIMDHGLPGEDGCEIIKRLRSIHKTKGIAVTANAHPLDKKRVKKGQPFSLISRSRLTQRSCARR